MLSGTLTLDDVVLVEGYYRAYEKWNGFEVVTLSLENAIDWLQRTQIEEKKYFDEGISFEVNKVAGILTTWSAEAEYPEEWNLYHRDGYEGWFVDLGSRCWTWSLVTE
jgi:hypothetical protein